NVTWTFTENASHSIYAKYTLTCKTDPTHTKEQTGSGTLMSTVAVDGDKFVYSHSAVKIDGISVAVPNYTRNIADGIINQYELKAAVKVAGEYKLANDITGFYDNVKPVDGFVLDGQNHMIKYGTMNANNRVMFVAADQNTKFTLKNITLDGNNRAKWAVCAYTDNGGNNAGNVITLDTVTIQNFKSNDYVGAINAFGSSTWNLKDCTITGNTTVDDSDGLSGSAVWAGSKATINIDGGTYDEVYLHSYSGTGAVLNADGGATIDNLVLDLTKTDTLKANIDEATVGAITSNEGTIPEEAVVMDPAKATVAAPEGYKWVDSDETGMKTLAQIVYVAQIGTTKYETLADAFAAAQDGDIITVLADSAGNGIKVAAGKFATNGLTVDFNGHTYTVNSNTVGSTGTETQGFQLLKNNKITFENGTINGDSTATATLKFLIQNYSDLTLDNMNLELVGKYFNQYTLSNNNGNIVINDSTINAPDYTWAGLTPTQVNSYAFDVCRYASYPSVNVTVTGNSTINGDVQVDAGNGDPKNGFSLTLESGTLTGDIVLTDGAKTAINADPEKANVTKANDFTQEAPEGYEWVDNGDGTSTLGHVHDYTASFNWTQSAEGADWDCDTLTLTCSCGDVQTYPVTGFFGASAVTCTANDDGSFTYSVSKAVDGVTYSDTKTVDADGHIKTNKQLTAAAKKGGEWQLDNDLNGVVNVVCADGFVLDGQGYKVTRNSGVDTNPVFRINSNPAEVTLKNLIIDGIEGRSNTKAAIATRQSNPSAGNVLNLENVHIENYNISATNNGAVLAWGQATVNLKDSTVTTDSTYDVWAGAAATVNIDGGTYGKVYLNGGTSKATVDGGATVVTATYGASAQSQVAVENGTVRNIALADGVELAKENFIAKTPETALVNVPAGYVWVDSETTGMKTLDKAPADLFVGYGLSLQGDIGLIFYLDPAAAGINIADVNSVAVDFDCDHYTYQVTDFAKSGNYIKVTCYVPAAYMAHDIEAYHVKINDVALDDTDTYSVQQYAERIIEDP
ncbi:MAG: hypothetical protein IJI19_02570, partial [Ruminococcus sp.]|nr:hypothetical protein [Ruminococcus sp.]